jgi:cytochrome c-type biogenesis protein CcmH/NrfG
MWLTMVAVVALAVLDVLVVGVWLWVAASHFAQRRKARTAHRMLARYSAERAGPASTGTLKRRNGAAG